jgi:outer membrane protein OmpA-like peptidoglycan-associated protein
MAKAIGAKAIGLESSRRNVNMMRSKIRRTVLGTTIVGALGLMVACATDPSDQLVDARQTYGQAYASEANQLVPDRVYEARLALEEAERQHERDAGSDAEKHLAYIAQRKALLAIAEGDLRAAEQGKQEAQRQREEALISQRDQIREQLDEEQQRLEGEEFATAEQLEQMEQRRQEEMQKLEEQRQERMQEFEQQREQDQQRIQELEQQREQEMQELRAAMGGIATVDDSEQDEMKITLDGVVLFQSGESDLLPPAENRLATVASALEEHASDKRITIEGHTDSTGPAQLNEQLSKERADSVKEFLVAQGIEENRIETVGKGPNEPMVPNDSPTNRAMNRRVEIILGDAGGRS